MIRQIAVAATLCVCIASCGLSQASAADAADPNGKWKITLETPNGAFDLMLEMKAEGEKLSGKITIFDQMTEFKDGTFKDNEVAFKVKSDANGQSITSDYKGKIEGDTIKGKVEFEFGGGPQSIDWVAKREKA